MGAIVWEDGMVVAEEGTGDFAHISGSHRPGLAMPALVGAGSPRGGTLVVDPG